MRRHQLGFNLVELMLAVAVLSIILAYGVPSFYEMIRGTQVRGVAESLQNGLQRARAEAIKRNRPVTFWLVTPAMGTPDASCALSSTSGSWVVSMDNPATKCHEAPSDSLVPRIVQVTGSTTDTITIAATSSGGSAASSVTFNPYGQPLGTSISQIDITHPDSNARQLRLQISSSGGVRMCDRAAVAPDTRACL